MSEQRGFYWRTWDFSLRFWRDGTRAITIWWPWRKVPRIYIPPGYAKVTNAADLIDMTLAHERVHITQWMKLGRIRFLLRYMTKAGRMDLEAQAYAATVRWLVSKGTPQDLAVATYAQALADHYGSVGTTEECRAAILKYIGGGR